jgi:glycosyltransferase involved in cell wall biosynthesis
MKVCIISTAYNRHPVIISSLICQTHQDWELHIIHDGQNDNYREWVNSYKDKRIIYSENIPRQVNYGHPIRQKALQDIKNNIYGTDCNYIVITNEDNYFVPTYLQKMIEGFKEDIVATYCSMLYNQIDYNIMNCTLQLGNIDCSCVMVRKDVACDVGWRSMEHSSDWIYFSDIIQKYGADKWIKVGGYLIVHN